jgi:hypothetical protein
MAGAREYAYESVSGQRLSFEAARLAFDDPFAGSIIASCIAQVTRRHGGADSTLIRFL